MLTVVNKGNIQERRKQVLQLWQNIMKLWEVVTVDIPGAFALANMVQNVYMKLKGTMVTFDS
jgi:hypothetical protein